VKVALENDADASALGEASWGAGKTEIAVDLRHDRQRASAAESF